MKEYLLLIRSEGDCAETMSPEVHKAHLQRVINYIGNLKDTGRLISAQPLTMKGSIIQGKGSAFKDGPFIESKEVIAGYFLFRANDYEEATEIAKSHPILEDDPTTRIELREIKKEDGIN
ncbi:MAG: hypothetical protein JST75_18330 [Bacteroidetes bacterium]|nr:hypothetical protein [Bacteroidota bacterium]